jgi:16S rRNA (cytosine967-C5)-methyltransferase
MKISPARTAAYECLSRIENEHIFSSTLVPQFEEKLTPADRSLCHELVLGVLRRQILLDAYIDQLTLEKKLDFEIRLVLRLGLFQIIDLDRVPDHAVVNDSVNLAVKAKKASAKGLVNAVLRKAIRGLPSLEFANEIQRVAVETSHPEWLLRRWVVQFGTEKAESLAVSNNQPAPLSFRRTIRGGAIDLHKSYRPSEVVPGCFFADSINSELQDLAHKGLIYFQDEGSQLVASALELKGSRFLDVCASPGGKTGALAMRRRNSMPAIFAGDVSSRRVELLRKTCEKQGAEPVDLVQYDASSALPFQDGIFDTVLVDAPCTGTGTIRHNPEIRYFLDPDDLSRIPKLQLSILKNASKTVCSAGKLVYSTCSLETEENESVVMTFLRETPEFRSVAPDVPNRFLTTDGFARTFPSRDQMDGFFIATFVRA